MFSAGDLRACETARPRYSTADQGGRVEARRVEQMRAHCGRRRLSVGAGNRDRILGSHHLGEQGTAADDRDICQPGCFEFGIVVGDR